MPYKAKPVPIRNDLSHSSSEICKIGDYCSRTQPKRHYSKPWTSASSAHAHKVNHQQQASTSSKTQKSSAIKANQNPLSPSSLVAVLNTPNQVPNTIRVAVKIRVIDKDPSSDDMLYYKHVVIPSIYYNPKSGFFQSISDLYVENYDFGDYQPGLQIVLYDYRDQSTQGVQLNMGRDSLRLSEGKYTNVAEFLKSP